MAQRKEKAGVWLVTLIVSLAALRAFAQEGTWATKAPLPLPLVSAASGVVKGKLYVAGGWDCSNTDYRAAFEYDPSLNAWRPLAPMPTMRLDAASAVVDEILYVIGGDHEGLPLSTVQGYDPKTDSWSTKASMPTPRSGAVAGVIGGVIYVDGGSGGGPDLSKVEAYDPKTDTWTEKAPMLTARSDAAAGVINGILYVVGGSSSGPGSGPLRVVEAYDPKTNTWTSKAPMPTPRYWAGGGVIGGLLYVVGGTPFLAALNTVETYDPKSNTWSEGPAMPTGRFVPASGVADDVLYVVGGQVNPNGNPHPCLAVNEAFSPFLPVSIDIKPGDATNTINLQSRGVIPVAILGSATFDPMTVDPTTVTLAGAPVVRRLTDGKGVAMTSSRDVNHDGYPDLVLFFRTEDMTALTSSSSESAGHKPTLQQAEAVLYGTTYSGQRIRGSDSVRIVPAAKPSATPAFGKRGK